jgi:predicted nucleotidyltransferase component of viral defense system
MRTSTQLKARIRNLSAAKGVEAEVILRNFMLERFLERIALSVYHDNFILKGGILIASMVGIDTRTTIDLDATIKGETLGSNKVVEMIEDFIEATGGLGDYDGAGGDCLQQCVDVS